MHPKNRIHLLALLLCLLPALARAQTNRIVVETPDLQALSIEDKALGDFRFSAPVSLNLAPAAAPDAYTNPEGTVHLWSRKFFLPGAHGLALFLDELNLPQDASLIFSNGTQENVFTQADASSANRLFTGFLAGEEVTLTYRGPLPEAVPFHLWRLDHVYRPELWNGGLEKGFGDANDCHVNANCPEGDDWEDEKAGTARINVVVAEGVGFCTGNLINNTARDGRPYLLTGFHCMNGFTPLYDLWSIDFDYRFTGCTDEVTEPTPTTYTGVAFRAGRFETDFLLLEIMDVDFASEDHYFAGWDRNSGDVPGVVRHFHHPQGDVQKVSMTSAAGMTINPNFINWNDGRTTPREHHFEGLSTVGSFEPGSSGSAFFNEDRRIIGQLNGGNPSCTPGATENFVGRFHLSWDAGDTITARLREWLDPLDLNPMIFDGQNLLTQRFVSGRVVDQGGIPVVGAEITFGSAVGSVTYATDANGNYRGERPPLEALFGVSGVYRPNGALTERVDVGDIINIRRHILGFDTLSPVRLLASD
ncbi:MAG: carboxypeptidase-like regulatory domain-containing protein, partial [Bacteroidota bacterium]